MQLERVSYMLICVRRKISRYRLLEVQLVRVLQITINYNDYNAVVV